jgi:hypothetical protein
MVPYGQGYGLGEFAVFCNSGIDLKKNTTIEGNVGTNATEPGSINCKGDINIVGNVLVGPGGDPDKVITGDPNISGETGQLDSERKYKVPDFPPFPDNLTPRVLTGDIISQDGEYKKINVNKKLVIDVGSDVRNIVVEELIIGGDIEIKGDGCLNLYVTKLGTNNKINGNINKGGNVNAVMVYYKGNTINMEKEKEFRGTIFANGDLEIKKDGCIFGNIIVLGENCGFDCDKDLVINGVIYAPHSSISFKKDTTVNGIVIADKVTVDKDFTLHFNYHDEDISFPYEVCLGFRKGLWSD